MKDNRDPRGWINTYTGNQVWPLDPQPDDIKISDIAHALAHTCRYSGHTLRHYSVAEHSVKMVHVLWTRGASPIEQRYALLHDASEAYLNDIPSPLKRMPEFKPYLEIEERLQRVINRVYGLGFVMPDSVNELDKAIVGSEARALMRMHTDWRMHGITPIPELEGAEWGRSAEDAELEFLTTFEDLWGWP